MTVIYGSATDPYETEDVKVNNVVLQQITCTSLLSEAQSVCLTLQWIFAILIIYYNRIALASVTALGFDTTNNIHQTTKLYLR